MTRFALELWDDEGNCCTFYSVRQFQAEQNETDKFFSKYKDDERKSEDLQKLLALILDQIGNRHGAIDSFFNRYENEATALPPKRNRENNTIEEIQLSFSFRLYCYRVNERIVVLFNGGEKTERTHQESPDLSMKFQEAQQFSKKIKEALTNRIIIPKEGLLYDGDEYQYIEL